MKNAPISGFPPDPEAPQPNWLMLWWARLSPSRQDRVAMLGPIASILLFLAANIFAFTYLRLEEHGREQQAVAQDLEYAQQRLRMRLLEEQEQLINLSLNYGNQLISDEEFIATAQSLVNRYPELYAINWLSPEREVKNGYYSPAIINSLLYSNGAALRISPADPISFIAARQGHQPIYSAPILHGSILVSDSMLEKTASIQLHIPAGKDDNFRGMLVAEYSLDGLLRYGLPNETRSKYSVAFLGTGNDFLTGTFIRAPSAKKPSWLERLKRNTITQIADLQPIGSNLRIQAQTNATRQSAIGSMLIWLVSTLSALTAYMLFVNWRHTRLRARAQKALHAEISFRRAMENSMPIGMRALDMDGRMTYVNPTFCKITGWKAHELIGKLPPYPYWPKGMEEQATMDLPSRLEEVDATDMQYQLQRRNGDLFDARIHISPLIDDDGKQSGWMTSLTDITEAMQIRRQLSEAHDRFTAVLEAFDAAVSVTPVSGDELLFANYTYRQWFGNYAHGHLAMMRSAQDQGIISRPPFIESRATATETEPRSEQFEIYLDAQKRWLEVRSKHLIWTDGRPAQMLIATDITARKQAEALAAAHTEKAMATSHLVTMGEMASSMAHELNQPLTAINNYCNGMLSRVQQQQITLQELAEPLEKTAKQAQRAGQIIHRIRAFVKRSAPNRTLAHPQDMVNEAKELFDIELRKRRVRMQIQIDPHLPDLQVDPILIEQVLVNLVKNAAEAIDNADLDDSRRAIVLRVQHLTAQDQVEFAIADRGLGLSPDVLEHLFEAFFSTKQEGMGIGLNLCRSIVEAHGGKLIAQNLYNESQEIVGCQFSFTLPVSASLQISTVN